jgi:hypothetical protein
MLKLGDKVKDRITGFTGIVVARTDWLYGCVRFVVQPQTMHDGKPVEPLSFDEDSLEMQEPESLTDSAVKATGGDRDFKPTRR